jgi:hypothetical protein
LDKYIHEEDYVSYYMRKHDFEYTKDKVEEYSKEITYFKNHKEFAEGFNVSIYHHDIQMLEKAIQQISKTFTERVKYLNNNTLSTVLPKYYKSNVKSRSRKQSTTIPELPLNHSRSPNLGIKNDEFIKKRHLSPTPNISLPIIDSDRPLNFFKKPLSPTKTPFSAIFLPKSTKKS